MTVSAQSCSRSGSSCPRGARARSAVIARSGRAGVPRGGTAGVLPILGRSALHDASASLADAPGMTALRLCADRSGASPRRHRIASAPHYGRKRSQLAPEGNTARSRWRLAATDEADRDGGRGAFEQARKGDEMTSAAVRSVMFLRSFLPCGVETGKMLLGAYLNLDDTIALRRCCRRAELGDESAGDARPPDRLAIAASARRHSFERPRLLAPTSVVSRR